MVNITCKQARCKESGTQQKHQPRIRNAKHSLGQQSPCYLSPTKPDCPIEEKPMLSTQKHFLSNTNDQYYKVSHQKLLKKEASTHNIQNESSHRRCILKQSHVK